jgi:hypothetical protein
VTLKINSYLMMKVICSSGVHFGAIAGNRDQVTAAARESC